MVDALALREIFSIQGAAWTAVTLLFLFIWRMWNASPAMFAQWIDYRRAKAEEKSADWNRLREEIKRLSEAEQQCRRDYQQLHNDYLGLRNDLADLRGYMAGQGRASQEAAGVVALERLRGKPEKD